MFGITAESLLHGFLPAVLRSDLEQTLCLLLSPQCPNNSVLLYFADLLPFLSPCKCLNHDFCLPWLDCKSTWGSGGGGLGRLLEGWHAQRWDSLLSWSGSHWAWLLHFSVLISLFSLSDTWSAQIALQDNVLQVVNYYYV